MYTLFLHLYCEVSSSLRREGEKEREEGEGGRGRGRGKGEGKGREGEYRGGVSRGSIEGEYRGGVSRGSIEGEYRGGVSRERERNFIPSTAHLSSITGARHVAFRIGNLSL